MKCERCGQHTDRRYRLYNAMLWVCPSCVLITTTTSSASNVTMCGSGPAPETPKPEEPDPYYGNIRISEEQMERFAEPRADATAEVKAGDLANGCIVIPHDKAGVVTKQIKFIRESYYTVSSSDPVERHQKDTMRALIAAYKRCQEGENPETFDEGLERLRRDNHRLIVSAEHQTVLIAKRRELKRKLYSFVKGIAQRTYSAWPTCHEHGPKRLVAHMDGNGARAHGAFACMDCPLGSQPWHIDVLSPRDLQRAYQANGGEGITASEEDV